MLLIRIARMTTTWTKTEHRDPGQAEPIFRPGDRIPTSVRLDGDVATLPESAKGCAADLLLAVDDRAAGSALLPLQFQPRAVERPWALFGLRLAEADAVELWLRDGRGLFYAAPRRAEYRLAVLRPGEVTRVLHNAKNDFSMAGGRERTYRWNDILFEPAGVLREIRFQNIAEDRPLPLHRAKIIDLRENLL